MSKVYFTNYSVPFGDDSHNDPDVFAMAHPDTDWDICFSHAEKLGLGERKYEIISVK